MTKAASRQTANAGSLNFEVMVRRVALATDPLGTFGKYLKLLRGREQSFLWQGYLLSLLFVS